MKPITGALGKRISRGNGGESSVKKDEVGWQMMD